VTELGETTGTITRDLSCVYCGYNLRTLAITGRCPECGEPVATSLRERPFRFRNDAMPGRLQRGLLWLTVGILTATVGTIALTVVMLFYYRLPRGGLKLVFGVGDHVAVGAQLVTLIGLVLISYPLGRRGDRFWWPVGIAVLALGALGVLPGVVELILRWFAAAGRINWMNLPWIIGSSSCELAFLLACALAWLQMLARVRYKRNKALWLGTAVALLLYSLCFVWGVRGLSAFIARTKFMSFRGGVFTYGGPAPQPNALVAWLGDWQREIALVISIVTMSVVWLYIRRLRSAIRDSGAT
jgi:hypothetical protein